MKNRIFKPFVRAIVVLALAVPIVSPALASNEPGTQPAKVEKLTAADRQKIQRVITLQIKAFERNDDALAFSYSTPEIRKYFGSSRTFMEMVRSSYSVLYVNSSREFLEASVVDGQVVQPLRIVTHGGETLMALYTVARQSGSEWRIGGCELTPSTLQFI